MLNGLMLSTLALSVLLGGALSGCQPSPAPSPTPQASQNSELLASVPEVESIEIKVNDEKTHVTMVLKRGYVLPQEGVFKLLQAVALKNSLIPEDITLVDSNGTDHSARLQREHGLIVLKPTKTREGFGLPEVRERLKNSKQRGFRWTADLVEKADSPPPRLPKREVLDRTRLPQEPVDPRSTEEVIPPGYNVKRENFERNRAKDLDDVNKVDSAPGTYVGGPLFSASRFVSVTFFVASNARSEQELAAIREDLRHGHGVSKAKFVIDNRSWDM